MTVKIIKTICLRTKHCRPKHVRTKRIHISCLAPEGYTSRVHFSRAFQLLEYQWRWREGKFDKLTPSSLPPYSMFMTEVTSMITVHFSMGSTALR